MNKYLWSQFKPCKCQTQRNCLSIQVRLIPLLKIYAALLCSKTLLSCVLRKNEWLTLLTNISNLPTFRKYFTLACILAKQAHTSLFSDTWQRLKLHKLSSINTGFLTPCWETATLCSFVSKSTCALTLGHECHSNAHVYGRWRRCRFSDLSDITSG